MVSLRFRPEWFKSRSLLGYGADWPLDWREMWNYYAEVEQALKIAGPVDLSLGTAAPALSLSGARAQRRREGAGAAAARRWGSNGPRPRWPRSRRRAAAHPLRLSRTSARPAARPTPNRARWLPGFRARSRPARKSATSPWSAASRRTPQDCATGVHYHPRRPLAVSARQQCRRCRLCDRDAAAAVDLGHRSLS